MNIDELLPDMVEMTPFRLLVAGSRDFDDQLSVDFTLDYVIGGWLPNVIIIEGGALGADTCAKNYAISRGIPYEEYMADWTEHGRSAGYIRNKQMFDTGVDGAVLFHLHNSRGTYNMLEILRKGMVQCVHLNFAKTFSRGEVEYNMYQPSTRSGRPDGERGWYNVDSWLWPAALEVNDYKIRKSFVRKRMDSYSASHYGLEEERDD